MSLKSRAGGGWNKKSNLFPVRNPEQTKKKFYGSGVCLCVCKRIYNFCFIYSGGYFNRSDNIRLSTIRSIFIPYIFQTGGIFYFGVIFRIFWFVRPGKWMLIGRMQSAADWRRNGECQKLTENIFWCFSFFFFLFLGGVSKSSWWGGGGRPGVLMEWLHCTVSSGGEYTAAR